MLRPADRTTLAGKRNAALVLLGFATAARVCELVALDISTAVETEHGHDVTLYRKKVRKHTTNAILYSTDPATCTARLPGRPHRPRTHRRPAVRAPGRRRPPLRRLVTVRIGATQNGPPSRCHSVWHRLVGPLLSGRPSRHSREHWSSLREEQTSGCTGHRGPPERHGLPNWLDTYSHAVCGISARDVTASHPIEGGRTAGRAPQWRRPKPPTALHCPELDRLEIAQLTLDLPTYMPLLALAVKDRLWEPRRPRHRLITKATQLVTAGRGQILCLARHCP